MIPLGASAIDEVRPKASSILNVLAVQHFVRDFPELLQRCFFARESERYHYIVQRVWVWVYFVYLLRRLLLVLI